MRVTFNQVRDGLTAINAAADQYADAQWQVSTGTRVRVPSDDPAAAQRAVRDAAEIGRIDSYSATNASANSRTLAMDSALQNLVDKIQEGLVAVASAQGSTATQDVRNAAAATIEGIRDAIAADINTSFGGSHLFAGGASDQAPYAKIAGAWTYQGDNNAITVDIAEGRVARIGLDGQAILQGSSAQDLLTALDTLASDIRAGSTAGMAAGNAELNAAATRVGTALATVGYDENNIADSATRLSSLKLAAQARLSEDRDANIAEAITKMSRAKTTYEAALGAVGAASKVSLLDYLK